MKYRRLGKTNLNVSVIGLGTWQFGGEWGKDFNQVEVTQMLRRANELGINLLDTAECYGAHLSESLIGAAIEKERKDWIIATKFGHKFHGYMDRTDERSAKDMVAQLDASLRALRTDYVDILQYHSVRDSEFDDLALQDALQQQVKAGKVRHIGNSISSGLDYTHQCEGSEKAGVEVLQVIYNRLDRRPEENAFPIAKRQDLGILARVPLASGFLSGKYKPGARFEGKDQRSGTDQAKIDSKLREVEQIAREEVPAGVNMAQWALAWCLRRSEVTSVIPGAKNVEQVESNAAAANLVT